MVITQLKKYDVSLTNYSMTYKDKMLTKTHIDMKAQIKMVQFWMNAMYNNI